MKCVAPPTHAVGEGRSAPATQAFSLGPEVSVAGSWLCPSRLKTSWMETQDNDSGHPGHAHTQLQLDLPGPDRERDVGPKRGRKIPKWEDSEEDDCSVVGRAGSLLASSRVAITLLGPGKRLGPGSTTKHAQCMQAPAWEGGSGPHDPSSGPQQLPPVTTPPRHPARKGRTQGPRPTAEPLPCRTSQDSSFPLSTHRAARSPASSLVSAEFRGWNFGPQEGLGYVNRWAEASQMPLVQWSCLPEPEKGPCGSDFINTSSVSGTVLRHPCPRTLRAQAEMKG